MTDAFLHASPDERIALIEARLTAALAPLSLTVRDDSAQHAGHAGASAGGHGHDRVGRLCGQAARRAAPAGV